MKGVMRKIKAKGKATLLDRGRGRIVSGLKKQSTDQQLGFLAQSLESGVLSTRELRRQLESNARREMRKGATGIRAVGREPTVDELLREYHEEKEFQVLASRVGLDEQWFISLAEEEIRGNEA